MTTVAVRRWIIALFFTALIMATRLPFAPHQLVTFDDVNLAYSIGHFDIRVSQPQPPGYPLFVMEMRALSWLRFRRAENILLTLALAGSIAALLLTTYAGNRIMGKQSGFYGALLLAFNPVFWHSGVASALRIQLAIASLAVGVCCWRAWEGDRFWVPRSAIVLGLAAGVRPEVGPLLFPLWAASAWRARIKWEDARFALGAMIVAVLMWLAPAMWASGGPAAYVRACLAYISDQASVTSGLFGSEHAHTTFWHLVVWTLSILPGCIWAAAVGLRKAPITKGGRDSNRSVFLALWFAPGFVFAWFVHLEDPGQALAMVVVIAILGGYLIQGAIDSMEAGVARWQVLVIACGVAAGDWMLDHRDPISVSIWIIALVFALMMALRVNPLKKAPIARFAAVLLLPSVALNVTMFNHRGWYYHGLGWTGQILEDLNSGLALTSLEHIRTTLATDDHAIRDVKRLTADRPAATLAIWEQGLVTWRKLAYYAPQTPIAVLEHRHIRGGAPVISLWTGPHREETVRIEASAGERIVWLLNPRTEFYSIVQREFAPRAAGSVLYTDLPAEHGSRTLGEYELRW